MLQKKSSENEMVSVKTSAFRKNFLFCKLMYNNAKIREYKASENKKYTEADNEAYNQQLLLKLSYMELCGWIEAVLDDIYISIGKTEQEKELIERHISTCYGFKPNNLISCLKYCLGDIRFCTLKDKYNETTNKAQKKIFFSKLEQLSEIRNEYAHTCYDAGTLQGGQLGIKEIQEVFIYLLKVFSILHNELANV